MNDELMAAIQLAQALLDAIWFVTTTEGMPVRKI
jgi:hypothetical protein